MAADHEAVLPACELAASYLEAHEREEEAGRYRERAMAQLGIYEAATTERAPAKPRKPRATTEPDEPPDAAG